MPSSAYNIAQANITRMKGTLDSPVMADFVKQLEAINAGAAHRPGFVWRLQTAAGDSTDIRAYDDERILFNMSVWTSMEDLHFFVYRGGHSAPFRDRNQWFEPIDPPLVLWWIPAGHTPTVDEAKSKFELLRESGPSPKAFTFKASFPAPSA